MNKQELIKHVAEHAEVTVKQAEAVINSLTTTILDTVRAGGELQITTWASSAAWSVPRRPAATPRPAKPSRLQPSVPPSSPRPSV